MEYSNLRDEIAAIRQKLKSSEKYKYSTVHDELEALRQVIDSGSGGGAGLESITYAELKAKRDNGELTPGGQYRITDYVCTTTQAETRAVSHPFDIIVVADDESTLNENARACEHVASGPTVIYEGNLVVGEPQVEAPFIDTQLDGVELPTLPSITVDYDGAEYILPKVTLYDAVGYGYYSEAEGMPDFTTAPIFVDCYGTVITPIGSTGTHTLKIEYDASAASVAYDGDLVVGGGEVHPELSFIVTQLDDVVLPQLSSITVTYDGTEYTLPAYRFSPDEHIIGYGYVDMGGPDLTTVPIFVGFVDPKIYANCTEIFTPIGSTGTHTLKIEYANDGAYYANCNLEAWELKYCIDNDTTRFGWADDESGKGVIFYMKDDRNNECPYDFKQIQLSRYKITECEKVPSLVGKYTAIDHSESITGIDEETPIWCYTFSSYNPEEETVEMFDGSVCLMSEENENGITVRSNKINEYTDYQDLDEETGPFLFYLNNIVFCNTFEGYCSENIFMPDCCDSTFGDSCNNNTFGCNCKRFTFGSYCGTNVFGNDCGGNTFGCRDDGNDFDIGVSNNTLGDNCHCNTLGNNCNSNTFGNYCNSNTFGNDCFENVFDSSCQSNTLGDHCGKNTFGMYCKFNSLGDDCYAIEFESGSDSKPKQHYHVLNGVRGNKFAYVINGTNGNDYVTYVGKDSNGNLKTWIPSDLIVSIDLSEFSQMTAQQKSALFDKCINALKFGIPVCAIAYGYTTFANGYNYTETNGVITLGTIGFLGTASVSNMGSASLNAATVKKEDGDVTFSVAPINIGS